MKEKGFYGLLTALVVLAMGAVGSLALMTRWDVATLLRADKGTQESLSRLESANKVNEECHIRIEQKMDAYVSRREFDTRILQLEADMRATAARLREIDLEILKLKSK